MNHLKQGAGKPYTAKGSNVSRCSTCFLSLKHCICEHCNPSHIDTDHPIELWLLTHKEETYKPTNTGRLIEQVLPEHTKKFIWHRTEPDTDFMALLKDERYQPYIIFPGDRGGYEERVVQSADQSSNKIPAFIILDGSWRQAGRMFRLSQYLQNLPVLPLKSQVQSEYKLRKAPDAFHLCTVEVAIALLADHKQVNAAANLKDYFNCFNDAYTQSRRVVKVD